MALFTFGEGYHNYHHEFQHDYRNGVKPWQWDPTKWLIWSFSKIGLTSGLRRARAESISSSEAKVRRTVTSDPPTQRATARQASDSNEIAGATSATGRTRRGEPAAAGNAELSDGHVS
jgi:stearoyl-CoA desaturase (delta-9 desaturase)